MTLKIEMLRGFVAVARYGNLSDAANELNRTPSAISMMLKQLETHLGEPLFETDRKNRLTALGSFVLEQSEQEILHFNNTVRAIESYANASLGHIRIATVPSIAGTLIPGIFSNYIKTYSNVSVELRDMDSKSILVELMRGRIDLGIATWDKSSMGLCSQFLLADRFGVICAPDHPLGQITGPIDWPELENTRLISNSLSEGINSEASRKLHSTSRLSAHNLTSIIGMARAKIGVTILPEMVAKSAGLSDLVFRPLADTSIQRQIHLLRKADSALSPAARMLEAEILDAVKALSLTGDPDHLRFQ